MSSPDRTSLENRIVEALRQEAGLAMSRTNTQHELERFQAQAAQRRNRSRQLIAVAATVITVAAITTGVVVGTQHSTGSRLGPKPPGQGHPAAPGSPTQIGPAKPLAEGTPITTVHGPVNLGVYAFGAVWATDGDAAHGTLIRVSPDGKSVLSRTPTSGVDGHNPAPVQIGHALVVADGSGNGFTVYDQNARKIGSLPSQMANGSVGDASGGWVTSGPAKIARVDASGLHITQQRTIPGTVNIIGIASGNGGVWLIDDIANQLLRINPSNGAVEAHVNLPAAPGQITYQSGAVYVSMQDHSLRRYDASTLKETAAVATPTNGPWPGIASSTAGLWMQPADGVLTQLNPTTLNVMRNIQVFPTRRNSGTFGAVITRARAAVTDGASATMYSFPLS